jgi:hypothetical protein
MYWYKKNSLEYFFYKICSIYSVLTIENKTCGIAGVALLEWGTTKHNTMITEHNGARGDTDMMVRKKGWKMHHCHAFAVHVCICGNLFFVCLCISMRGRSYIERDK